ncbi:MAG: hypothetical protein E7629_00955 [Ruminococcaceae bacterium]|nr:hypothetical protein [Oscillospiraceae bacterium]
MKKTLAVCCIFCALLCGCSAQKADGAAGTEELQAPTFLLDAESGSDRIALDAAQSKIVYYEGLLGELQQEILDLKTQLYTNRVEYESQISDLKGNGAAEALPSESLFEYTKKDGKAILTAYRGNASEVRIPATLDGYPVVAIADRAFENNTVLASVVIPSGVKEIGWFAFSGCVFLTDVTLPASLQSVEYGAFENCSAALTIRCPVGSYAQVYARSYGFRTVS